MCRVPHKITLIKEEKGGRSIITLNCLRGEKNDIKALDGLHSITVREKRVKFPQGLHITHGDGKGKGTIENY